MFHAYVKKSLVLFVYYLIMTGKYSFLKKTWNKYDLTLYEVKRRGYSLPYE